MIIVKIRAEVEPTFKDWRKKVIKILIDKNNIFYMYFVFKFQAKDLSESFQTENS